MRWSPNAYPADPQDGLPLPFGEDGWFPAIPGTVHAVPLGASVRRRVGVLQRLRGPCRRTLLRARACTSADCPIARLRRSPCGFGGSRTVAPRLAITLRCSEPLVSTGVTVRLDSTHVRLTAADNTGTLWTGTAEIAAPGSSLLTVCARDSVGNEACAEGGIAAAAARPSTAGRCLDADGRLLVEWSADAFASEGLVTVIGAESGLTCTFEVVAHEPPIVPLRSVVSDQPGRGPGNERPTASRCAGTRRLCDKAGYSTPPPDAWSSARPFSAPIASYSRRKS